MIFEQFWPGFDPSNHWFFRQIRDKNGSCFSVFGSNYSVPSDRPRIFYSAESHPWNSRGFQDADFTVSFHDRDKTTHLRLPNYVCIHGPDFVKSKIVNRQQKPVGGDAACMVVSNNNPGERKKLAKVLQEDITVHCGGKVMNNVERVPKGNTPAQRDQHFVDFAKHYKFVVAGENERKTGYTTEKLFNAFRAGSIPIYWGNPEVSDFFNDGALLHCNNFESFKDVSKRVQDLLVDQDAYREKRSKQALPDTDIYDKEHINEFIQKLNE